MATLYKSEIEFVSQEIVDNHGHTHVVVVTTGHYDNHGAEFKMFNMTVMNSQNCIFQSPAVQYDPWKVTLEEVIEEALNWVANLMQEA